MDKSHSTNPIWDYADSLRTKYLLIRLTTFEKSTTKILQSEDALMVMKTVHLRSTLIFG